MAEQMMIFHCKTKKDTSVMCYSVSPELHQPVVRKNDTIIHHHTIDISSTYFASKIPHCQSLIWDKGIPNTVQCAISDPLKWYIGENIINTTDSRYRKIYGYIPDGRYLYVYHPKHNQIIKCSKNLTSYCYRTILKRCLPKTCQNNGQCKMIDSNTPIERVTCLCKHLSKGYKCNEKYESMAWVTVLLWLAVLFEITMIVGAIYRNENQNIYKGAINRRFVDIIGEPDELFQ
ncbi:unnamed protein product [Wuchereria bancrofti]|uniref:EGF-like domain-containing protein n=1 Tax=Wuchereria bancrofti TaxID=6293 RepID=A0A3P7E2U1_WUCBA|nr:unnamed protein product [Wuchereria bancrofti]